MYQVDLRLYVNQQWQKVDLDKNTTTFAFNLQFSDIEEPTSVHAPFSVEVTLPATGNNNRIFDSIYGLDSTVLNFNPLLRTDFILHVNQNIFQTGYIKLERVDLRTHGTPLSYVIRMYGGLGEYMYVLSETKLSDLDFGGLFDHRVNRGVVDASWRGGQLLNLSGTDISNHFGYAMTYQGQYDNFDSDYVVNSKSEESEEVTWYNQNKNYTSVELDEHKRTYRIYNTVYAGEYRSYYQKPMVKLQTVFIKMLDTLQQQGWKTELDETFFNPENPYWEDTWIICPNYNSTVNINQISMPLTGMSEVFRGAKLDDSIYIPEITGINELELGKSYSIHVNIPFYMYASISGTQSVPGISKVDNTNNSATDLTVTAELTVNGVGFKWLTVLDKSVTYIKFYKKDLKEKIPSEWSGNNNFYYTENKEGEDVHDNQTCPTRDCGTVYTFTGIHTLDTSQYTEPPKLGIKFHVSGNTYWIGNGDPYQYGVSVDVNNTDAVINAYSESSAAIRSNSLVTFKNIIQSDVTLKDFMLSYVKPFGLLFDKDATTNTVRIVTRNTFYQNLTKLDWTHKLDYSKKATNQPIPFNYKTGVFQWQGLDTKYERDYENRTDREYGSVRFDTNFAFGDDEKSYLDDNIFNNCVIASDYSQYYLDRNTTLYKDNKTLPHFKDNSESGVDIDFVLVFRDGYLTASQPFLITDDNSNMLALGYAWTTENYQQSSTYPKLLRSIERAGQTYSLNFGRPAIAYNDYEVLDDNLPDTESIFYRFWKSYLEDRFSLNSKRLLAYVNLNLVDTQDNLFSKFIYINNTLWVINKINAFNPLKPDTTQVELLNVQNIESYVGQNYLQGRLIIHNGGSAVYDSDNELAPDTQPVIFNTTGTTMLYTTFVTSFNKWSVGSLPTGVTVAPSQASAGSTDVLITFPDAAAYSYDIPVNWGNTTTLLQLVGGQLEVNDGNPLNLSNCSTQPVTFPVTASADWEITSELPDWLTISQTSGTAGTTDVTLTPLGTSTQSRAAVITFRLIGTVIEYELNVSATPCMDSILRVTFRPSGGIETATVRVTMDSVANDYPMTANGTGVQLEIDEIPKVVYLDFMVYTVAGGGGAGGGQMSISPATPGISVGQQCINSTFFTVEEFSPTMEVRVTLLPYGANCS